MWNGIWTGVPNAASAAGSYQEISRAFLTCYLHTAARPGRNVWGWVAGAGVAAAILLAMVLSRRPVDTLVVYAPSPPPAPIVAYAKPAYKKPAHRAAAPKPIRQATVDPD